MIIFSLFFLPIVASNFSVFLFPSPYISPFDIVCLFSFILHPCQCVVNLISELQEQMCKFQEEISTRIQEKRALEEKEARQGDPSGSPVQSTDPNAGSNLSSASLKHSGERQTVHVWKLMMEELLLQYFHHFSFSSPLPS